MPSVRRGKIVRRQHLPRPTLYHNSEKGTRFLAYLEAVDSILVRCPRTLQKLRVKLTVGTQELQSHRLLVPPDQEVDRRGREVSKHLYSKERSDRAPCLRRGTFSGIFSVFRDWQLGIRYIRAYEDWSRHNPRTFLGRRRGYRSTPPEIRHAR